MISLCKNRSIFAFFPHRRPRHPAKSPTRGRPINGQSYTRSTHDVTSQNPYRSAAIHTATGWMAAAGLERRVEKIIIILKKKQSKINHFFPFLFNSPPPRGRHHDRYYTNQLESVTNYIYVHTHTHTTEKNVLFCPFLLLYKNRGSHRRIIPVCPLFLSLLLLLYTYTVYRLII